MKTVHKSVLIWYSADEMFALVNDVARYPEFLPWCDHGRVLSASVDADGTPLTVAEVGIALGGVRQKFTTRNRLQPGQRLDMVLVDGPFSRLDGGWRFTPLGQTLSSPPPLLSASSLAPQPAAQSAPRACKVELSLQYDFSSMALRALVGPVFDKIAGSLVDAFVKRAEQVYGSAAA